MREGDRWRDRRLELWNFLESFIIFSSLVIFYFVFGCWWCCSYMRTRSIHHHNVRPPKKSSERGLRSACGSVSNLPLSSRRMAVSQSKSFPWSTSKYVLKNARGPHKKRKGTKEGENKKTKQHTLQIPHCRLYHTNYKQPITFEIIQTQSKLLQPLVLRYSTIRSRIQQRLDIDVGPDKLKLNRDHQRLARIKAGDEVCPKFVVSQGTSSSNKKM